MTELILIDLDDTLWDTQANNKQSLNELYTALDWGQYFVSFEDFFAVYHPINVRLWEQYNSGAVDKDTLSIDRLRLPLAGYVWHTPAEWLAINDDFMARVRTKRGLCPNALSTLQHLHARYRVCLISNGFGEVQYAKVEDTGLRPYIDAIVLSEEVGINKPDARIFAHALELCNASPERSVMIGDSWGADIVGASNAGIPSIWYNPHRQPLPPASDGLRLPRHVITDLAELTALLPLCSSHADTDPSHSATSYALQR